MIEVVHVRSRKMLEVWYDDSVNASWPQDPVDFTKKAGNRVAVQVLEEVGVEHSFNRA